MKATALQIARLGMSLLEELIDHDESDDATIDDTLIAIAQTANRAHKQHTGDYITPSLIRQEPLIN